MDVQKALTMGKQRAELMDETTDETTDEMSVATMAVHSDLTKAETTAEMTDVM